MLGILRARYADLIVDDPVHDDYGISIAAPRQRGVRPLPFLARGCRPILRSGSVARLLRALDGHLEGLEHPSVPGLLRINNLAVVVREDRACLVPHALVDRGAMTERALRGQALTLADWPVGLLDPQARNVVVRPALRPIAIGDDDDRIFAGPGTYELLRIFRARDDGDETSRARTLAWLLHHVADFGGLDPQTLLEMLADLIPNVDPLGLEVARSGSWERVASTFAGEPSS